MINRTDMKRIGIISDTHGSCPSDIKQFLQACDEVWHAGDVGSEATLSEWERFKPLTAVYGNIDDYRVQKRLSEWAVFKCEDCKIIMTHIGGYPGRYNADVVDKIKKERPDVLIDGHSHILKVMRDPKHNLMFFNPGAAGNHGLHQFRTALRLKIEGKRLFDLEVLEIPRKSDLDGLGITYEEYMQKREEESMRFGRY